MTSLPTAQPRNPALRILDIVAGIALLAFGAVLALVVFTTAVAYGSLHDGCTAGGYEGMTCSGAVLAVVVYGLMAVAVLGFFGGLGMFVVSLLRRRVAFLWPLGASILILVLFWIGTWVLGMTLP